MVVEEIRNNIAEKYSEDVIMFDGPAFDKSVVGIYEDGEKFKAVYNIDLMAKELAEDDNITLEEAYEFIEYNTIRALPYIQDGPIIIESI